MGHPVPYGVAQHGPPRAVRGGTGDACHGHKGERRQYREVAPIRGGGGQPRRAHGCPLEDKEEGNGVNSGPLRSGARPLGARRKTAACGRSLTGARCWPAAVSGGVEEALRRLATSPQRITESCRSKEERLPAQGLSARASGRLLAATERVKAPKGPTQASAIAKGKLQGKRRRDQDKTAEWCASQKSARQAGSERGVASPLLRRTC
jgi:hypothetical protein